MPRPCFTVLAHLKLFALAVICIWSSAHADEYSDVNQLRKTNLQAALGKAEAFLAGKPADPQMRFLKGLIQSELGKNFRCHPDIHQADGRLPRTA